MTLLCATSVLVKVEDIMDLNPPIVDKDSNLREALDIMREYERDRVLVVEEKKLVGIVTKKDIMVRLATLRTRRVSISRLYVSSVMSLNPIVVTPDTLVDKAIRLMVEADVASLPVVKAGSKSVVGLLTRFEICKLALEGDVEVSNIARPMTAYLREESTLLQARRVLIESNLSIIPVIGEGNSLKGIVSVDEVTDFLVALYDIVPARHRSVRISKVQVSDFMKRNPPILYPDENLGKAVEKLLERRVKGGVVLEEGKVIGILTLADIVRFLYTAP